MQCEERDLEQLYESDPFTRAALLKGSAWYNLTANE